MYNSFHIMASQSSESYPHFGTLATHAGQEPEQWKSLAVVPPISLSTTFKQLTPGQPVSSSIKWDDEGFGPKEYKWAYSLILRRDND